MIFSYKKTAIAITTLSLIFCLLLLIVSYRNASASNTEYKLKDYNGKVALYRNNEIITVYDGIVISSLPNSDKRRFMDGVYVKNPEEAEIIIEDYDG